MRKKTLIWLSILIGISYLSFTSIENNKEHTKKIKIELEQENAKNKARFERGAYIASESKLSEYETTKTIIYPGKNREWYDEMFDSTCLIYINTITNKTNMNCTGVMFDK